VIVAICGDRRWSDAALIWAALRDVGATGVALLDAGGACRTASAVAEAMGLPLAPPADARRVVAFHDYIDNSTVTRAALADAKSRGRGVSLYSHLGIEEF